MSYEDDWDRNRCSHGHLGHDDPDFFGNDDRGMFGPRSDEEGTGPWTPEYTEKWLRKMERSNCVDEYLKRQRRQEKMMKEETPCAGVSASIYPEKGKTEMAPCPMGHSSKEIFVLVNKAVGILDEAFGGISEEDKETLRKMVVKGKGHVDTEGEMFMAVYGKVKSFLVHIRREITEGRPVQTFEIWREGFEDEDGKEQAVLLAKDIPGSDFADAVEFWYSNTVDAEHIYGPLVKKGEKEKAKMWLWGCRLYDNEQDAKRRFG